MIYIIEITVKNIGENLILRKHKKVIIIVNCFILLFLLLFIASVMFLLFQRFINCQLISDFPAHISAALNDQGYSLTHLVIKFAYTLFRSSAAISAVMTLIVVLTVVAVAFLLKKLIVLIGNGQNEFCDSLPSFGISLVALFSVFSAGIYIEKYRPYYYFKLSVLTQPWHNSTYLLMRLLAVMTLIFYFQIEQTYYKKKIEIRTYFWFAFFLTLTNFSKPNFVLGFAPIMLFVLGWDFVQTKTKSFVQALLFGCCVLISLIPLIFQTSSLYGGTDESAIILITEKWELLLTDWNWFYGIVSEFLFPIIATVIILIYSGKHHDISLRILCQGWLFLLMCFLQGVFMEETGPRANHGNYTWGQYFFALLLYLICAAYLFCIAKKNKKVYWTFLLYVPNIISGIMYFSCLSGWIGNYGDFLI